MGEKDVTANLEGSKLQEFTRRVLEDLRALERILAEDLIESDVQRIGAEQEMFLIHDDWRPALKAYEMLEAVDDDHFTTEIGLYNLECNLDPQVFEGACLNRMELQLRELMKKGETAAAKLGIQLILIGILPTIRKSDLGMESMVPEPRYHALAAALDRMRGSDYEFHIKGQDELMIRHHTVMLESCNTSFQAHLQVTQEDFARLYNISQVAIAPVLAAAVNSPILFGRRLWHETRIALFQQSIDTRSSIDHLRERRPRVTFGSDWIRKSVLELYREDVGRFRSLLGTVQPEDPLSMLDRGEIPKLTSLSMHNGTVYRWNRACYGISDGKPHLRIENRVLPAGPTITDEMANTAFWLGLMLGLPEKYEDITEVMSFGNAKQNFQAAATNGLRSQFHWLEDETIPAQTLICDRLIPLAADALKRHGINKKDVDHYLGVVDRRVRKGMTGAEWQLASLNRMTGVSKLGERLNAVTAATVARQREGKPVAEWELASLEESGGWKHTMQTVEQYMTTDLFTVNEDEPIELVANLMDWEHVRHIPVEDLHHKLVGLVSYRMLIRLLAQRSASDLDKQISVSDIMRKGEDLITITPETPTVEAMRIMRSRRIGCLPVIKGDRLVGVITQRDFMDVARDLLQQQLEESEAAEAATASE
jgi:CBS domain-containing protein